MVGWHHPLNGHEFEQTLGDDEGQGSLACSCLDHGNPVNAGYAGALASVVRPRLEGKPRTPLSSRVATCISWRLLSGLKGVMLSCV